MAKKDDIDHYEYGLPIHDDEMFAQMRTVVAEALREAEERGKIHAPAVVAALDKVSELAERIFAAENGR